MIANTREKHKIKYIKNMLYAILQEALKFMQHAKRTTLTTEDVNSALKLQGQEARVLPVCTHASHSTVAAAQQSRRRQMRSLLCCKDLFTYLIQPLYGYSGAEPLQFDKARTLSFRTDYCNGTQNSCIVHLSLSEGGG